MEGPGSAGEAGADVLLARSARLRLYLMIRRTVAPERLRETLDAHLRWIIAQERLGRIFLSGPIAPTADPAVPDGMTVIRAADLAEAAELAGQDPFVQVGAITFQVCEWTVNEGSLSLHVSLSDSGVRFG